MANKKYRILKPVKFKGEIKKNGFIEMPEDKELERLGYIEPTGGKKDEPKQ